MAAHDQQDELDLEVEVEANNSNYLNPWRLQPQRNNSTQKRNKGYFQYLTNAEETIPRTSYNSYEKRSILCQGSVRSPTTVHDSNISFKWDGVEDIDIDRMASASQDNVGFTPDSDESNGDENENLMLWVETDTGVQNQLYDTSAPERGKENELVEILSAANAGNQDDVLWSYESDYFDADSNHNEDEPGGDAPQERQAGDNNEHEPDRRNPGEFHDQNGDWDDNGEPEEQLIFNMRDAGEPLQPGSVLTKGQAIVILTSFLLRHVCTNELTDDLLEMMNLFSPGCVPSSRYLLETKLRLSKDYCEVHICCKQCSTYIGCYAKMTDDEHICPVCDVTTTRKLSLKEGSFFLYMKIEQQLKELLPRFPLASKVESQRQTNLSSPLNGMMMRELMNERKINDQDITLTWNCDGAPLFSSSKRGVWFLSASVNEIETIKSDNALLLGVWHGVDKPNSTTFFKPFVDELTLLGDNGMNWTTPNEMEVHSRVFALCSTCDSCARPFMRECMQFNGAFGCDWCCMEGVSIERGAGHARIYPPPRDGTLELRTDDSFKADARAGTQNEPSRGVRGVSTLFFLPNFSLVTGFVPDYLHCVLLGVVRSMVSLFFDSCNHGTRFYLGNRISQVDARLKKMKPPTDISRLPRSLGERRYWKGTEYENFLLYYCLIILSGMLPLAYYQHLFLLVFAVQTLIRKSISMNDVEVAEKALLRFVKDFPNLYGEEHCTFNVHQLLHIPDAVRNWGPLPGTSCFRFENLIGESLRLVKGTKMVPMQICRSFRMRRYLPRLASNLFEDSDMRAHFLIQKLLCHGKYYFRKFRNQVGQVSLYGALGAERTLNASEAFAVFRRYGDHIGARVYDATFKIYKRFSVNHMYITTREHNSDIRTNDNTVVDSEGDIFIVESMVVGTLNCECQQVPCLCDEQTYIFGRKLLVDETPAIQSRPLRISSASFLYVGYVEDFLTLIHPNEIAYKSFRFVSSNGKYFVVPLRAMSSMD